MIVDPARAQSDVLLTGNYRKCHKGCQCKNCVSNARWDRIFQEKFEDPTYYTEPSIHRKSSLSDL